MKRKSRILFTSIASIAMCASLAVGGTFALFTDEAQVNVAVNSGTVDVYATVQNPSMGTTDGSVGYGVAEFSGADNTLTISNFMPKDTVEFTIKVENRSSVPVQYQTVIACAEGIDLFTQLNVEVDEKAYYGMTAYSGWQYLEKDASFEVPVKVTFPENARKAQGAKTVITYKVDAVQGNAGYTSDEFKDFDENTYPVYTAQDLVLFQKTVEYGNNFADKTIKVMDNIDLANMAWSPIGTKANTFAGTFDGNGKTIANVNVNTTEDNAGFFGYVSSANLKNVTLENVSVKGGTNVGGLAGSAYTGAVENCHVKGVINVEGETKVGGLSGYGYATLKNCSVIATVGSDSTIKGVYVEEEREGDNVGGLIGHASEGNSSAAWAERVTDCKVENLTVVGTRKVGGAVGILLYNAQITNTTVNNVTVKTNTTVEYAMAKNIFVGGLVGEFNNFNSSTATGSVKNTTVIGTEFEKIGEIYGGSRNAGTFSGNVTTENNTLIAQLADGFSQVSENEYEISSAADLANLNKKLENKTLGRNSIIELKANIDFSGYTWTPVDNHADSSTTVKEINGNGYILRLAGDNKNSKENLEQVIDTSLRETSGNYVIGKVTGESYAFGLLIYALKSPVGIVCIVIIPCLIVIVMKQKEEDEKKQKEDEIEELKRKLAELAVDENGNVTEKVVPGCEFVAEMRLTNEGDVAYGYYVKIIVANASEKNLAIREQMKVTVTSKEDPTKTFTKSFAEADKNGMIALGSDKQENGKNDFVGIVGIGKTAAGEAISQNFTISVMFEDLAENNAAQLQQVDFDLVVYAVQVAR